MSVFGIERSAARRDSLVASLAVQLARERSAPRRSSERERTFRVVRNDNVERLDRGR
jgi:hypothetical protein